MILLLGLASAAHLGATASPGSPASGNPHVALNHGSGGGTGASECVVPAAVPRVSRFAGTERRQMLQGVRAYLVEQSEIG
jgi:hypothetical protein